VNAGPVYRLSAYDSINLFASYYKSEFGSNQGGFQGYQGTIGYQRTLDAAFVGRVYGGVAVLTQDTAGQQATTSGNSGQQMSYTGGASLSWARRNSQATLAYTTGIFPNYIGVPGAMVSTNVSLFGGHRFVDDLAGGVSLKFADNTAIGGQAELAGVQFRSYSTTEALYYSFNPLLVVSLIHEWGFYTGNFTSQGEDKIIRNAVTISLMKAWF